jgi:hypothetical protein
MAHDEAVLLDIIRSRLWAMTITPRLIVHPTVICLRCLVQRRFLVPRIGVI